MSQPVYIYGLFAVKVARDITTTVDQNINVDYMDEYKVERVERVLSVDEAQAGFESGQFEAYRFRLLVPNAAKLICELCEDAYAIRRVLIADLDGGVVSNTAVCKDCIPNDF